MVHVLSPRQLDDYVKDKGIYCPLCRHEEIYSAGDGGFYPLAHDETIVEHTMECGNCGAQWIEQYKLAHIELLEE